jgi:TP901 family phage tail tape measure protein
MSTNSEVTTALRLTAYDKMSQVVNSAMNKSMGYMNRFQKMANKVGGKGSGGSLGLGNVITATAVYEFGKNAVEMAEKYEDATIQMKQAMTNAAGVINPAYYKLLKLGDNLASSFKGGKVEMYGMMNALINTGMSVNDITSKFATSVNQYATVMKIPYSDAATLIGKVVKMSKIATKDISALPDLLSRMKIMGITNAEDIAQAVGRSGMGVIGMGGIKNMQSMAAIIVKIQQATGNASSAGMAMQVIMSKMADPEKMQKFNDQLAKAGINMQFYDKKGKFLGLQNMVAQLGQVPASLRQSIFGQQFGRRGGVAAAALADLGVKGYNETLGKMMHQQSLAKKSMEYQERASYQLAIAMSSLKGVMTKVGLELIPIFTKIANIVKIAIWRFREWYDGNKVLGGIIKWVTISLIGLKAVMFVSNFLIGGMFRNISSLIGGFMKAATFIKSTAFAIQYYTLVIKSWTIWSKIAAAGQWMVNTAFLGCPIVWIIVGLMAVIAAVVLVVKYWKPITAFFGKVWGGIKTVFNGFNTWFKGWGKYIILPLMPFIGVPLLIINNWSKITSFFTSLWSGITGIFNKVVAWFSSIGTKFFNAGKNIVKSIWEGIKSFASKPIEAIMNIVKKIRDFLPFSPAKMGPLKDLHKIKIMETIAASIKPMPVMRAMQVATGGIRSQAGRMGGGGGGAFTINYNVNISGGSSNTKEDIIKALKAREPELMRIIKESYRKSDRKSY